MKTANTATCITRAQEIDSPAGCICLAVDESQEIRLHRYGYCIVQLPTTRRIAAGHQTGGACFDMNHDP